MSKVQFSLSGILLILLTFTIKKMSYANMCLKDTC